VNLADTAARAQLLATHPVAPTRRLGPGRLLHGEVDDDNARAMRGIAGHAGLFASLDDVAAIAQALLDAWAGKRGGLVAREVVQKFWRPAEIPGSTWRLGWDGPAAHDSAAGERIARSAVGHLGFTGCSIWIDPEQATFVVVLANRVHPTAGENPRFRALRPALHDAVLAAMGYERPAPARTAGRAGGKARASMPAGKRKRPRPKPRRKPRPVRRKRIKPRRARRR